jgi:hypothetical protein
MWTNKLNTKAKVVSLLHFMYILKLFIGVFVVATLLFVVVGDAVQ